MSETQTRKIHILLVDDHALFRESVARFLSAEPDFELAAHCATVDEALTILDQSQVDIVLLDFDLGSEKGSRFLVQCSERGRRARVLVVTAGLSDTEAAEVLRRGAAGIFRKHDSPVMLTKAIRKVVEGEAWLDQRYLRMLVHGNIYPEPPADEPRLSDREREVLRSILRGLTNKEIAGRLSVSESSVKATLQQLFAKTGVRTRSQLVRIALEKYKDYL